MESYDEDQFGMAGKTIGSLRRNVIRPLKKMLRGRGYTVKDNRTDNILEITKNNKTNYFFYLVVKMKLRKIWCKV